MSYQSLFDEYKKDPKRGIQVLRAVCEHLLYGGQGCNKDMYQAVALVSGDVREYMDTINMLDKIQKKMEPHKGEWDVWLTYDEWKARGYQVLSGEKATWKKGIPMFLKNQTRAIQSCKC